jgi:hypothetical protein
MNARFKAIYEKLDRADENICNFDLEINRFFQESDYPTIPQNNRETMLKAVDYHRERPIPLRFSVLAGRSFTTFAPPWTI